MHVFVCENPNVVALAADALGDACAPLVCIDGMPAAAQQAVLSQLREAGARLHYHGDFDWPGISIANFVMQTWKAAPWRMSTLDYEKAAAPAASPDGHLTGRPVAANWDEHLADAMQRRGRAVAEEAVVDALLQDLSRLRPTHFP